MKGLSRIWVLALGIAVAIAIIAVALLRQEKTPSSYSGTPGITRSVVTSKSATLLKKVVEVIDGKHRAK